MQRAENPGTLLIRADASAAIGTGHVMRCLALAQAWQDAGGQVAFVMAEATPAIEERLRGENMSLHRIDGPPGSEVDCAQLTALARSYRPWFIVVDGYRFGAAFQKALKNKSNKVLLIDDNGLSGSYSADIVLNQNMHAAEHLYQKREENTRLILGTNYALLRREFSGADNHRPMASIARKLLVSMGGSDPENVTLRVMEAIEKVEIAGLEVTILLGGSNPHLARVAEAAAQSRHSCRILHNLSNMRDVILWADLVISAAGSACWEYCALGLPAILVVVAENQANNAQALASAGAAKLVSGGIRFAIGEMAKLITCLAHSVQERQSLSQTGRTLVDGGGAARIVSILRRMPDVKEER